MRVYEFDRNDPVALGYRRFRRSLRNLFVVALVCSGVLWFLGLPHIQYTYRHYGGSDVPSAMDKVDADYWSITGWKEVEAGQYARGCPIIVFIPLGDCLLTEENQNRFPYQLLPRSK